jgi:prevent-host-death family protein
VIGVAEAKRRFSELMSRVLYKGERFLIERKGKPVAAMVGLEDLKRIEQTASKEERKGLLAAVGAWADFQDLDQIIAEIYRDRKQAVDRKVKKLP